MVSSVSFVHHLIQYEIVLWKSPDLISQLGRPPLEMLQSLTRVFWWSLEISIEASSVSKMPWKFLRKHRRPLNQVAQLLRLITCSFCRSWLGFTTNRSGLPGGWPSVDENILGMLGTCPICSFAQCGFLWIPSFCDRLFPRWQGNLNFALKKYSGSQAAYEAWTSEIADLFGQKPFQSRSNSS